MRRSQQRRRLWSRSTNGQNMQALALVFVLHWWWWWWWYRAERQNKVKTKRGDAWAEWKGTDHSLWQIQIQHGAQQDITVDLRASFDDYLLNNWANEEPRMSRTRALERVGIRLVVSQMNGIDGKVFKSRRPGPSEREREEERERTKYREIECGGMKARKGETERTIIFVSSIENDSNTWRGRRSTW